MLGKAKLDATGHRWVAALSAYHFKILYKPGRTNSDADGLSRRPPELYEEIDPEVIRAICNSHQGLPLKLGWTAGPPESLQSQGQRKRKLDILLGVHLILLEMVIDFAMLAELMIVFRDSQCIR